jgi:hypothetical protein
MHGGARGSGGPKNNDNYKHGLYTAEANVQPGIEHCVLTRGAGRTLGTAEPRYAISDAKGDVRSAGRPRLNQRTGAIYAIR